MRGKAAVCFLAALGVSGFRVGTTTESLSLHLITVPQRFPFSAVTFFVPNESLPLPLQLILGHKWFLEIQKECPFASGQVWWTLGGWGFSFVVPRGKEEKLFESLSGLGTEKEEALTVRKARWMASVTLSRWRRRPLTSLLWLARLKALGRPLKELEPESPLRVSTEGVLRAERRLSLTMTPLLVIVSPSPKDCLRFPHQFRGEPRKPFHWRPYLLRLTLSKTRRSHWLRWWVTTESRGTEAFFADALLCRGVGAKWMRLIWGIEGFAYDVWGRWTPTPFGDEWVFYGSPFPSDLSAMVQKSRSAWVRWLKGSISAEEFDRAKRQALLRYRKLQADPQKLSRFLILWIASGRSIKEWRQLPFTLEKMTMKILQNYLRCFPLAVTEIVATPR